jgi:hypothetical protein
MEECGTVPTGNGCLRERSRYSAISFLPSPVCGGKVEKRAGMQIFIPFSGAFKETQSSPQPPAGGDTALPPRFSP